MSKSAYTYWIFCDESGNLSNPNNRYLIGAAVGTRNPEALRKAANRIYEQNRRVVKKGKPLHATELDGKVVLNFLKQLVKIEDLTLSIVLLDKQWLWNYKSGYEALYNELFAYLVQKAISETMQPLVVLERRDSYKKYEQNLIAEIQRYSSLVESQIALRGKNDAEWGKQLQAADAIAWSTYQKYEKQDERFFERFKEKISSEIVLGVDGVGIMRPVSEMNN